MTEGTPNLGVTSYWTDADGNVVYGPNTPKEKVKTPVAGAKMQKRTGEKAEIVHYGRFFCHEWEEIFTTDCSPAESVTNTAAMGKAEENKELQVQTNEEKPAAETKASDPKDDDKQEAVDQPLSKSSEQHANTISETPNKAECI